MQLPGWFRALVVLVLLAVCVTSCWYCISMESLAARQQELLMQLDTSRGRERRQQREYNQVCIDLPAVQAQLDEVQPLADAAIESERLLRSQRKSLRSAKTDLTGALTTLSEINDQLAAVVSATQETRALIPTDFRPEKK